MEGNTRWMLTTAVAPVAWGTTYWVTKQLLPAGHPLWGSAIRALPAGVLLLLISRKLPAGPWWWRSVVLGLLNVGAFFALVYLAAQLLPSSIASTVMATSPLVMMGLGRLLLGERAPVIAVIGAILGVGGVCSMLLTGTGQVRPGGLLASAAALVLSNTGYVLTKKWGRQVDVLACTSWQLIAGGSMLIVAAVAVEGAPPGIDGTAAWGFLYLTVVGTAAAFVCWFTGLRQLPAGSVGLIGLLNPVAGIALGVFVAQETLSGRQITGLVCVLFGVMAANPALTAHVIRRKGPDVQRRGSDDPNRAVVSRGQSPAEAAETAEPESAASSSVVSSPVASVPAELSR